MEGRRRDIFEDDSRSGKVVSAYEIAGDFSMCQDPERIVPLGNGHINDTYLVECGENCKERYVLQRINEYVFHSPELLMENMALVTSHIRKKITDLGGDPGRESLSIIPTRDDKLFLNRNGKFWRMTSYIENSYVIEGDCTCEEMYEAGRAFGRFSGMLADLPAEELHETIEGFHDTHERFKAFLRACEKDRFGRTTYAQEEIRFVLDHEQDTEILKSAFERGDIPLKVTHNDTKLNNILFDRNTGKALCVIDLDTVMPGLAGNDFGDAIRSGICTVSEDEPDLDKVSIDIEKFRSFAEGFLKGADGLLTDKEKELLPFHVKVMTLECGIRFLTDYLEGDVYFKTGRENHNLERCRLQFKIVSLIEDHFEELKEIIRKIN